MKGKKIVIIGILTITTGCSIGPRRLQSDCIWTGRRETKAENVVVGSSIVGLLGGFATFLGSAAYASGHKKSNIMSTVGAAGFATAFLSIPFGWYAMGAAEEIPAPFTRYKHCRDTVWKMQEEARMKR